MENEEVVIGENEEAVGSGNDARIAMMEQIADGKDEIVADEFVNVNDDDTTEPFKAVEETEEVIEEPEATPQKYKIKVNGREFELTPAELVERAQKVEAADQYLAEAARLRNEAMKAHQPKADTQETIDDDLALARAIQMGDEEEAVAAIRRIRSAGPSPDDLTRTIDERLTFNEALSKFRTEYSDIVSDPYLHKLALEMDAEMISKHDQRSYYERYEEIGRSLRTWVSKFKPEPVVDKAARKAAAATAPKVAAGKSASAVEEEKEESVSDVIAGIAKSRGGLQWMSGMNR